MKPWDEYGGKCKDCKESNDPYMVKFELWNKYVPENNGHGLVCLKCFENRMGRKLVYDDFIERHTEMGHFLPINFGCFGFDCGIYVSGGYEDNQNITLRRI